MNDGTKGTLLALSPLLRYLRKGKSLIKKNNVFHYCFTLHEYAVSSCVLCYRLATTILNGATIVQIVEPMGSFDDYGTKIFFLSYIESQLKKMCLPIGFNLRHGPSQFPEGV